MRYFNCRDCKQVFPLIDDAEVVCPACKGGNGYPISQEAFDVGFKAGAFFNIDPVTGKRAKRR